MVSGSSKKQECRGSGILKAAAFYRQWLVFFKRYTACKNSAKGSLLHETGNHKKPARDWGTKQNICRISFKKI